MIVIKIPDLTGDVLENNPECAGPRFSFDGSLQFVTIQWNRQVLPES